MNIESIERKFEYKYHGLKLEGEEYLLLQLQNLQLMQINENKVLVLILFQATLNHCKILVCFGLSFNCCYKLWSPVFSYPSQDFEFWLLKTLPLFLQYKFYNLHLEKIKHPLSQTRMCTNKKSLWSKTKHLLQTNLQIDKKK